MYKCIGTISKNFEICRKVLINFCLLMDFKKNSIGKGKKSYSHFFFELSILNSWSM